MHNRDTSSRARGEIRALTGLRGIAAAYVVVYHMLQDIPGDGLVPTVVRHGYIAVDLFFVLSGFVLAMVHGTDRFDRAGYAAFLRKRLARIYPLYAAVTLAVVALDALARIPVSPRGFAVNVALLQGWGVGSGIVAPSWSLSTEFAAYLAFPLLVTLMLDGSRRRSLLGAAAALALLAAVASASTVSRSGPLDLYQSHTVAPLFRCLGGFVLGLAAFRLWRSATARSLFGTPWASLALAVILAALLAWRGSDLLLVALMVPFVVALATRDGGSVGRALSSAPLHRLGVLSFSVYLVHFPIREWLRPWLSAWLQQAGLPHSAALATLICCGAAYLVAILTYRLIERPARSMIRTRLHWAPTAS